MPLRQARAARKPSGLPDRDEGCRDAGGAAVMRLGTQDRSDQRLNLIDTGRPMKCIEAVKVIFPAVGAGICPAESPNIDGQRAVTISRRDGALEIEHQIGAHVERPRQGRGSGSLEGEEARAE